MTFAVGEKVKAVYPNARWGEGEIIEVRPPGTKVRAMSGRMVAAKPLVVRRDDGVCGFFHAYQVEKASEQPVPFPLTRGEAGSILDLVQFELERLEHEESADSLGATEYAEALVFWRGLRDRLKATFEGLR